jgi:hypothetical protein
MKTMQDLPENILNFLKYNNTSFLDGIIESMVETVGTMDEEPVDGIVQLCYEMIHVWHIVSNGITTQYKVNMDGDIDIQFEQFKALVSTNTSHIILTGDTVENMQKIYDQIFNDL